MVRDRNRRRGRGHGRDRGGGRGCRSGRSRVDGHESGLESEKGRRRDWSAWSDRKMESGSVSGNGKENGNGNENENGDGRPIRGGCDQVAREVAVMRRTMPFSLSFFLSH